MDNDMDVTSLVIFRRGGRDLNEPVPVFIAGSENEAQDMARQRGFNLHDPEVFVWTLEIGKEVGRLLEQIALGDT